jgi:hypothetical protein
VLIGTFPVSLKVSRSSDKTEDIRGAVVDYRMLECLPGSQQIPTAVSAFVELATDNI